MIHVGNTDKEVLDWVKETVNCGSVGIHTKRKKRKIAWRFFLSAINDVEELLNQVISYLKIKRKIKVAELLLLYCAEHIRGGHITDVEWNIHYDISELNKRGV